MNRKSGEGEILDIHAVDSSSRGERQSSRKYFANMECFADFDNVRSFHNFLSSAPNLTKLNLYLGPGCRGYLSVPSVCLL